MTGDLAQQVAVLNTRVDNLEERFEEHVRRQNGTMEKIDRTLQAMNEKIDGRPSWAVTWVFTGLGSLVVGLAVALLSRGG